MCWASIVEQYLEAVKKDRAHLKEEEHSGLFYTARNTPNAKFLKDPIGKNTLGIVGKEVAKILLKPNPDEFTGHCWRRSSATAAAEGGATTMELRTHFDWAQDSMCKEYVEKSSKMTRKMATMLQPRFATENSLQTSLEPGTSRGQKHPAEECVEVLESACREQYSPAQKPSSTKFKFKPIRAESTLEQESNLESGQQIVPDQDPLSEVEEVPDLDELKENDCSLFDKTGDELLSQIDLDALENKAETSGSSQMIVNTTNTNPNNVILPSVLSGLNFNNCSKVSFVINYNAKS